MILRSRSSKLTFALLSIMAIMLANNVNAHEDYADAHTDYSATQANSTDSHNSYTITQSSSADAHSSSATAQSTSTTDQKISGIQTTAVASASDETVFPPANCSDGQVNVISWDGLHSTKCVPVPACPTQMLTFDGTSFSCVQVPTWASGTLLTYNGTSFSCMNVATALTAAQAAIAACTTTTQTNVQPCPAGEDGTSYIQVTTNCDGSITSTPVNNCLVNLHLESPVFSCSPGETVTGQLSNGMFTRCSGPGCYNYTCTASGLVAQ